MPPQPTLLSDPFDSCCYSYTKLRQFRPRWQDKRSQTHTNLRNTQNSSSFKFVLVNKSIEKCPTEFKIK